MTLTLFDRIKESWSFDDVPGLQQYLTKIWQERPLLITDAVELRKRQSTNQRFFELTSDSIKATKYVGFVQYGELRINVYPRVFFKHPDLDPSQDAAPAVHHLLKWLSYSKRIHFPFSETAVELEAQEDWLEALVFVFAHYTYTALSRSPYYAYQEVSEEMSFVRGRINTMEYIHKNLSRGKNHLLYCTYEPFLYDNLFNRVVKYTSRQLLQLTTNSQNKRLLNDLLFLLSEVSDCRVRAEDCDSIPVSRLFPEVELIKNMCASFLQGQSLSHRGTDNNLCLLLPMELIYEQYLGSFIQEQMPELKAQTQESSQYVAKTGASFSEEVFQMKHDIFIPGELIIDTKYKFRHQEKGLKGGVSQDDLYQMVTYCYKRNIKKGLLLYPKNCAEQGCNDPLDFKIESPAGDLLISARSIDITETNFYQFSVEQQKKITSLLNPLLEQ